jgi:hypothetical protein
MVLATVITIVNYDRKTFIVQATGWKVREPQEGTLTEAEG